MRVASNESVTEEVYVASEVMLPEVLCVRASCVALSGLQEVFDGAVDPPLSVLPG